MKKPSLKLFQRHQENFVCKNCGENVEGNGYTNHCPKCLYSMHVDINPGDRAEQCRGIMQPVGIEKKGEAYIIIHECLKCGLKKRNKAAPDDNFSEILRLSNPLSSHS